MDFLHPLALLALLPMGWAIYRSGRARLRRLPWLRALVTLLLRVLIASLLLLALAGPRLTFAAAGVHVVFVLDQSASMGPAGRAAAQAWVRAALAGRHADDTASLVAFGGSPAWTGSIPSTTLPPIPAVDADGTDIDAALRLAAAGLPPDQPSRLVLLSDGRQTAGDALQAAQEAAAAGVPISVVPIAPPAGDDLAVTSVDVPHYVRSGEDITLRIGIHAAHAATARVRLSLDGAPLGERSLALQPGLNSFFFAQVVGQPGVHDYGVQVLAPGDPVPQNNYMDAVTVAGPAPRLLVLTGNPADAASLIHTLSANGTQVQVLPPSQAPTSAAALDQYDAVVLADVPAGDLSKVAVSALQTSVHDDGHGLLVTGGPHSFSAGGYPNSSLEQMLPLTSLALAHAGHASVGLILIIDKSGSMMDEVQGVSKISMAQQAAIEAVAHLQPTDGFGVLAFDDTTHVIIPYGQVGDRALQPSTKSAILGIEPFGDTVIYPALRQAARYLFASHATFKHIVLMTDGQGETAPFLKLIKLMRQNNITLSTIAIGADAEVDELRGFANAGGGRFYYVADPHDIPRLVVLETRISSGPTRVEGVIGVRQAANSSALRSLVGKRLPALSAYNITTARPSAQVPLQSQLGDPLYAQWQYGLGRVAAWTGGTDAGWAGAWLDQRTFWSDALHGILPAPIPQLLRPDLAQAGDTLQIGVDALTPQGDFANLLTTRALVTGPDGRTQAVPLIQDAPGHYAATLPAPSPGPYHVTFAQYDGSTLLRQATGAIAVPYPAEYAPADPDLSLLQAIAAAGNAPTLSRPADAFSADGLPAHPVKREIWPALALLALLLFPLDVALRVLYTPPVPYDPARFTDDSG